MMREGGRFMPTAALLAVFAAALPDAAPASPAPPADLPEPVLSRALDAVLMPIEATARNYFGLAFDGNGALVLAVAPGGIAELYGIMPGDTIVTVSDLTFAWPDEIDPIVWAFLNDRKFDFVWALRRDGTDVTVSFPLVLSHFQESYLVGDIPGWPSWQEWPKHSSQSWSAYAASHVPALGENFEGPPMCGSCIAPEVAGSEAPHSETSVDAAADTTSGSVSAPAVSEAPAAPDEPAARDEPASEPPAIVSVDATDDEAVPASAPAMLRGSVASEPQPARIPQPAPPRPSETAFGHTPVDGVPHAAGADVESAAAVSVEPMQDGNAPAADDENPVADTSSGIQYYVFDDGDFADGDFDDGVATEAVGADEPDFCTRFPATCRLREQGYD